MRRRSNIISSRAQVMCSKCGYSFLDRVVVRESIIRESVLLSENVCKKCVKKLKKIAEGKK